MLGCAIPMALRASDTQARSVDCLKVDVRPESSEGAKDARQPVHSTQSQRHLHVVLTNLCGADITAFTLGVQVASPSPNEMGVGADLLVRLSPGHPKHLQLPLSGVEFPWDVALPDGTGAEVQGTVSVKALVFEDRTAAGDPALVDSFIRTRKHMYQEFLQEHDFLQKIAKLSDAKALLSQVPDPSLSPGLQAFWKENAANLRKDPSSWAGYIGRREFETQTFISIFQMHSSLEAEVAR